MTAVCPFDADVLHVLRAILGADPVERALAIVQARRPRPACLGRPALALIRDMLGKGCVRRLARGGGWLRERALRGDRVAEGRLWERTPPEDLGLAFSARSLDFLIRIVADEPGAWPPWPESGPLGDRLLRFFAFEAFRGTPAGPPAPFRDQALCRLARPADFARAPDAEPLTLLPLVEPSAAWALEALQGAFARTWSEAEGAKRRAREPEAVLAIGREQARVADSYLAALESAGRRDLARFFLEVARGLLGPESPLPEWSDKPGIRSLRFEDRAQVARASMASLDVLDRLRGWECEARGVGYFDDGYVAAQLLKSDWERLGGEGLWERARALRRAADPLAGPD